MCVVSMVYDDFGKRFHDKLWEKVYDDYYPQTFVVGGTDSSNNINLSNYIIVSKEEIESLRKTVEDLRKALTEAQTFIDNFKEAVKAAEIVDRLTGQPDCVDPAKKTFDEKITQLEQKVKLKKLEIELTELELKKENLYYNINHKM